MNKYYEYSSKNLSKGEGGLSSFRMYFEDDNDNNYLYDNKDSNNNMIYFIISGKKTLLPPSYKNYIEWSNHNYFYIVKPFKKIKYKFIIEHMRKQEINCIKITKDGNFIIIGYNNGVIEKYVLQKYTEAKEAKANNENFSIRTSISNFLDLRNTEVSPSNRNNQENTSRSKIAKKSARNRNIEQNPIFNSNNTNTSLLSTMKDSNYYSQESENLSKYIKYYYKSHHVLLL
jgi:hypothetical protein